QQQQQQKGITNNKNIYTNGIISASLNSIDLKVYSNYNFSWNKIGKEMLVTKAVGQRIYELDNVCVEKIYQKYLGKIISDQLPYSGIQFPLIINRDGNDVARDVLKKFDDGSLLLAGGIKVGEKVRFGCGNPDEILSGTFEIIKNTQNISIESIFLYSCTARKKFLGNDIIKEIMPIGEFYDIAGFFTYGEFFHSKTSNDVLNETLTFLCLSETDEIKYDNLEKISKVIKDIKIVPNKERNSYFALSNLVQVTSRELYDSNNKLLEWNKNLENKIIKTSNEISKNQKKYLDGYKSIIENINEMICIVDDKKNIIFSNLIFQNITGYSKKELENKFIFDLFLIKDFGENFSCDNKNLTLIKKNNSILNVLINKIDFLDGGLTIIIKDVDEILRLKKSYENLKILDEKKDEFLNIASHELRTPMTTIKGYISMLLDGDIGVIDDEAKKYLNLVFNDTNRLINLINDMLDISKIQSGKVDLLYEYINIYEFFTSVLSLLNSELIRKKININFKNNTNLLTFYTDKHKLKQILINIIGNAIKFTLESGNIDIVLNNDKKRLIIEVIDDGIGIKKEYIHKIFNKFSQIDNTLNRITGGT
ncbi:MAG: FIST C-terminal domain-containing protein, partial [Candidatus Gracilibacteria bacterium]|nr:FIST C-terminal domain-containing protein [Candidatus Gracilibacteria bacterium]